MSDESQPPQDATDGTLAVAGALEVTPVPALPPTRAERLRALEQQLGATSTRSVKADGTVVLALTLPDDDRIAGRGPTTEAALAHLEQRVAQLTITPEA